MRSAKPPRVSMTPRSTRGSPTATTWNGPTSRRRLITSVGPEDVIVVCAVTRSPLMATARAPPYHSIMLRKMRSLSCTSARLGFSPVRGARDASVSTISMPGPETGVRPASAANLAATWCARTVATASPPAVAQPATASTIHTTGPARSRARAGRNTHRCPALAWTVICLTSPLPGETFTPVRTPLPPDALRPPRHHRERHRGQRRDVPMHPDTPQRDPGYVAHVLAPRYAFACREEFPHLRDVLLAHVLMLRRQRILADDIAAVTLEALAGSRPESLPPYDPRWEDLYFALEECVASASGGRGEFRLALSRNDAWAAVARLMLREQVLALLDALDGLREAVLDQAERHRQTLMMACTHHQHAQPTTVAHYLLAVAAALHR